MVLKIVFIITLERLESIQIILCLLQKMLIFHKVIILIKSVVNKNENKDYYNIFLEKYLYKHNSNKQYF